MAEAIPSVNDEISVWDSSHVDGQKDVGEDERLVAALISSTTQLSDRLDLTDKFWQLLCEKYVLDDHIRCKIQAIGLRRTQVFQLLAYLMKCKVYQYHGFIWALVNSGQYELAEILGFKIQDYIVMEVFIKSSSFCCPSCLEVYTTKAYIFSSCGHYVCCSCVQGTTYNCCAERLDGMRCPVPECGTFTQALRVDGDIKLDEDVKLIKLIDKVITPFPKNKENKSEQERNRSLEMMEDKVKVLTEKVLVLREKNERVQKHEAELEEYVYRKQREAKNDIEKWTVETIAYIKRIKKEVKTRFCQSSKWQKITSDLLTISKVFPSNDILLDIPDMTMSAEANEFIKKLKEGFPASKILPPMPYRKRPPPAPQKAKLVAEWQVQKMGYYPHIAWDIDGRLFVTLADGLHKLVHNEETSQCTTTLKYPAPKPTGISVAKDGSWVLGLWDRRSFVVYNADDNTTVEHDTSPRNFYSGGIDNSVIYACDVTTPNIYAYDKKMVEKRIYQIDETWNENGYGVHMAQNGDLLITIPYDDRVSVVDPDEGEIRSFCSKGLEDSPSIESPYDACTLGAGEYIFIAEFGSNGCISVFTYDGRYLHDLEIEKVLGQPFKISVFEKVGESTKLAVSAYVNGKWFVKMYTLE